MTTETLTTEGQNTQGADTQQAATTTEAQATTETTATQQQATEGQTTEGQQTEAGKTEGEKAKPEGAPEKYEFTPPEGQEFDPHTIGVFAEVAKELNLSQADAQKVLDKMAPAMAERQAAQMESIRNEWADSSRADKEFGGDKLTESMASAKKALDAFATPELRTLLEETGLGNHPEVIRLMVRAGKAISEDSFVSGGSAPAVSDAKSFYPNSNMS